MAKQTEPTGSPARQPWHARTAEQTLTDLSSDRGGLTNAEAEKRRGTYGNNSLRTRKPKRLWRLIWEQIRDVMVVILLIAAIVSICFGDYAEAIVIFVIVVVNAVIGVVQEKKAADALAALSTLTAPTARVLRDGAECILPAEELVPGDVVIYHTAIFSIKLRILSEK